MSTSTTMTTPDPVMLAYGLYEEDGKIRFEYKSPYAWQMKRREYTYYTTNRELWRTYVRTKRNLRREYVYGGRMVEHIRDRHLMPIYPKHLCLDKGL